jgi:hypothetical protein
MCEPVLKKKKEILTNEKLELKDSDDTIKITGFLEFAHRPEF